jgi:uncharacterized protein
MNKLYISLALIFVSYTGLISQDIPSRPEPPRLVNDFAGLLNSNEIASLESKIVAFDDTTSTQIAVVIVKDLNGMDPDMMAYEIGQKWGVGQKGKNNGIVILVKPKAGNSRGNVAISVGYGLEAVVPDAIAKRIIENEIIPRFKEQQYYEGIDAAVSAIIKASKGEYKAVPKKIKKKGSGTFGLIIFGLLILFIISSIKKGNNNHHTMGGSGSSLPFWLLMGGMMGSSHKSGGGSDWGSFSSGSGSFGGFGGGGFGGGGASGSW